MKIIPQDKAMPKEIATALSEGKIIVYPTETCYGLGCDAMNFTAVEKIFSIKGREQGKPLLMIAESVDMVKDFIHWNDTLSSLADRHWPGPLTIVAPARNPNEWPRGILGTDNTLAFRVSGNPFARALCVAFGKPIVSTSANKAGDADSYSFHYILKNLCGGEYAPDIFIDAGDLPRTPPSTIVRAEGDNITMLRRGSIVV